MLKYPLHYAMMINDIEEFGNLCADLHDPEEKDDYQETVLFRAVEGVHPDALEILIEAGANVNVRGTDGCPVLHLAVEMALDVDGESPENTENALDVLRQLLDAGADVHAVNSRGETAAFFEAGCFDTGDYFGNFTAVFDMLKQYGMRFDVADAEGSTLLMRLFTARTNCWSSDMCTEAVVWLLSNGVNAAAVDSKGHDVIHYLYEAASITGGDEWTEDHSNVVRALLEPCAGSIRRYRDSLGDTLLHLMALADQENDEASEINGLISSFLKVHKGLLNVRNKRGHTALMDCIDSEIGLFSSVETLLKWGAVVDEETYALVEKSDEKVDMMKILSAHEERVKQLIRIQKTWRGYHSRKGSSEKRFEPDNLFHREFKRQRLDKTGLAATANVMNK